MDFTGFMKSEEGQFFLLLTATSIGKHLVADYLHRACRGVPRRVAKVIGLRLFPVKSAGGVDVPNLFCDLTGAESQGVWDRAWMVTTGDYTFVTARTEPSLLLIRTSIKGESVVLSAPSCPPLSLPIQGSEQGAKALNTKVHGQAVSGVDCGEEAAAWVSGYLGKPGHRLLCSPRWLEKRRVNQGPSRYHKLATDADQVAFQDFSQCSLMSVTSLRHLQSQLPVPVSQENFRANIIIDGGEAYEEDKYSEVRIGGAKGPVFRRLKTTDRCQLTTVNPSTGKKYGNDEPLHSMKKFRALPGFATPCFALSLSVTTPGVVQVGDDVIAVCE